MTSVVEIAPGLYRISTFFPEINLQFNQFFVVDDEPLLYHTGPRSLFPRVRDAVASISDPSRIRWISFSHFEADECGSLNEWLSLAPSSEAVCSFVGKAVSVDDFASRPARALAHGEVLGTGRHRFRYIPTPQVPHAWDAGHLFEETQGTLFCSDLGHQNGDVEPVTSAGADVVERMRRMLLEYDASPFAGYFPYTPHTERIIQGLADLNPRRLAIMHGSIFAGDGGRILRDMARMMKETLGR